MIPKTIKLIQEKEKAISIPNSSNLKCSICSNNLSPSSAYIVLTDNEYIDHISCDLCINNNMYFDGKVIFKDTFSNYQKRLKSGWIKSIILEAKNAKNKKSS